MQVVGGGIRKPIEGFKYSEWSELIPIEEVMYLRYFNPVGAIDNLSGSLVGMSPLRAAVMTAKKSNSAALAGVSAYENNGAMGIISKAGGQFSDYTQETAAALDAAWKAKNGGADAFGKIAHTPGQIEFNRLNMSPADLRLGESELQSMRQLGGVYKFPTQLINDSEGKTYSNQAAAQKSVYSDTIIPEMRGIGEGLMNKWGDAYYPNVEARLIPDTADIEVLQEDKAAQATWLVSVDFMTQNEKRAEMGLGEDPDPKMDDYLIPNGKTFKEDLDLFADVNNTVIDSNPDDSEE
jgi:phage portal protein BeeE